MKKINKLFLTMLVVFAMAIVVKLPANAAVRQIGATVNSITIQWDTPTIYYSNAKILGFNITTSYADPDYYPLGPSVRSYTVGGQPNNAAGYYYVHCKYSYISGGRTYYGHTYSSERVNTLPTPCSSNQIGVVQSGSNQVRFTSAPPTTSNNTIIQVFKGSKLVATLTGYSSAYYNVAKNVVYSYRMAYTYKNYSTGVTWTGAWSPIRKFCLPSLGGTCKSNKKGIKLTFKKTSGVTKYLLQTSRNFTSGYKNAKTVTLGKKSKKTFQLTKKYYKRATNYMKVKAYIKGYGWSDCSSGYSIYCYK